MAYVKPARPGARHTTAAAPAWAAKLRDGVEWLARLDAAKTAETLRPRGGGSSSLLARGVAMAQRVAVPARSLARPSSTPPRSTSPSRPRALRRRAGATAQRVLIIDSDGSWTRELTRELAACGLEPRVASDGQNGLDLARLERPDVIVLCAELSDTSGYAVCSRLKKDQLLRTVPIIITSELATPETFGAHRRLKVQAQEYLFKPVEAAELLQSIDELVLPPREDESVELPLGALREVPTDSPDGDDGEVLEEGFDLVADESDLDGDLMLRDAEELKSLDEELERLIGPPASQARPRAVGGTGRARPLAARQTGGQAPPAREARAPASPTRD